MSWNKYISELIGTFILVFCGTGAIVINHITNGAVGHLGIAMTFGLVVMAMIYSIGEISGAHINPAVTIAFWIGGRFQRKHLIPYLVFQITGALLASLCLRLIFPESVTLGETLPRDGIIQSFVLELILTFILMYVILHVSTSSKEVGTTAGIAIGGIVGLEAAFAGPICGASMNPARSIGPAVINMNLTHLWAYVAAPICGAISAVVIHKFVQQQPEKSSIS